MKTKDQVADLLKKVDEMETLVKEIETKEVEIERQKAASIFNPKAGESPVSHPVVGAMSNSDERRAMQAFGVNSVKELVKVNTASEKFTFVPEELKWQVRQLKRDIDTARAISQIFHEGSFDKFADKEESDRLVSCKSLLSHRYGREVLAPKLKAFGSTVSGAGDEWVPTLIAESYLEEYELAHTLESRFKETKMLSNPFDLPKISGVTKARIIAEATQMTGSNFGTDKIRFTATKLGEFYPLPEELDEDSAVAFIPVARDEVVRSQKRAVESAIINGDNDGTHLDSDTQAGAADLAEKAWKGLRRQAIANSANGGTHDFGGGAVVETALRDMRAKMGKFGVIPTELVIIVGPRVYQQLVSLDSVTTIDKFGPMATVLKGVLHAYQGIPIVISEHMRENLNDSGVYDGTTTTKAGLIIANHTRWMVGMRRPIVVKAQYDLPYHDRYLLASYQRKDFQGHAQSATETSVVYGVDILV